MHDSHHHHHRFAEGARVVKVALAISTALVVLKLAAAVLGKSMAIAADAVHSFSDVLTDIIVLLGLQMASRPIDKSHDYGHGKYETLTAAVISFILIVVGVRILWAAGESILLTCRGNILPRPGWIAFYAALISILSKEWLYHYAVRVGRAINSEAIIGNAWHHRSDALSSLGAMLGIGGAIFLGERWRVLDPAAAAILSLFIFRVAVFISFRSINELLESSLSEETESQILRLIRSIPGVKNPHGMKTRKIGKDIAVDIHIEVDDSLNVGQAHDISTRVERTLKEKFGRETFISVHIEPSQKG